uniref:redoxin domain-containing protein n=1 Tax=uncultured Gimesia sp. TaxID=1678688 RepID=UPI00263920C7
EVEDEQLTRLRYLGLAYYQSKKIKAGDALLAKLQKRFNALQADKKQAEDKARATQITEPILARKPNDSKASKATQADKSLKAAIEKAGKPFVAKIKKLERPLNALKGHQAVAKGEFKSGYELLKKAGGVDEVYLISVLARSGERDKAEKALRKLIGSHKNEVQPQAALVELLWQADKKEAAKKEFEKLKIISASIDLNTPLFQRLAPIAKELGFKTDWRSKKVAATDVGDRPDLKTLGPFRWKPSPAPSWQLKDATGKMRSSDEFRGKPHVLIFYLGSSCLHCAEQLQAFAPMVQEFEKAGFPLMAISTDKIDGLKTSIKNYDKGDLPIPLFSNDKLDVFKAFHAYDDFEKQPLHGTFIIDGAGKVLWQDISYEPFMDPKFVLKEAQRLLPRSLNRPGFILDVF